MTGETNLGIDGIVNVRPLDSGGFADVYEAQDEFGRRVAIKVLKSLDEAARRRFDRERSVMGMVAGHPHIVNPFTSGYTTTDGKPYVVMEFLGGGSLQQRISRDGAIPLPEAISLTERIAEALGASHQAGIIHKDVKPANILLSDVGTPKLADFGIASIRDATATTAPAYSPAYSPPETFDAHAAGDPRDERSDLYSLAATLYTLVSGQDPFLTGAESAASAMVRILNDPPPKTGYHDLDRFLTIAMAKNPAHRYQNAVDFAEALRSVDTRSTASQAAPTELAAPSWPGSASGPTPPSPHPGYAAHYSQPATHNAAPPPGWTASSSGTVPVGSGPWPPPASVPGGYSADSNAVVDGAASGPSRTPWLVAGTAVVALALIAGALFAITNDGGSDDTTASGDEQATTEATSQTTSDDGGSTTASTEGATTTVAEETPSLGEFGDLAGTRVRIAGREGGDVNLAGIEAALAEFSTATGIEVAYDVLAAGELDAAIAGESQPDIALLAQPIVVADYARNNIILPVPSDIASDVSLVWSGDWTGLGEVDGVQYAVPNRVDPKSLVWYKPARFEELGYQVPQSWSDLVALTEQAAADGNTPWCVGIESGAATGWPFTDWVEDVVLRRHGAAVYDRWVQGAVRFSDPEIVEAFDEVRDLWATPGAVHAEAGSIQTTSFGDNGAPLVGDRCLMHRQATFFASSLPPGTALADGTAGAVDVFYLPSEDQNRPLISGGAWGAAFEDRPEVWVVLRYLASPEYANARQAAQRDAAGRSELSGFLTAVSGVDRNLFTPVENSILDVLQVAGPVRFDASDAMPASVGAGSFWAEGTSFVVGEVDASEATAAIDASWPR
ncbi:MAG: protein kinase domain-containing protein [Acidimicrobiales bacterium]